MTVPFDYDTAPERYRLGMGVARAHSDASLYDWLAALLTELRVDRVIDVGCADGPVRQPCRHRDYWSLGSTRH